MNERSRPSRRHFLALAGGAAGSAVAGAGLWAALVRDHVDDAIGSGGAPDPRGASGAHGSPATTTSWRPPAGSVLVVVQLGGGNDGLNTLVPADGRYRDARPTLALAEADLAATGVDGHALHPGLAPLLPRWRTGQVAAVQGVGFAAQTRSHFTATDTWWAGTGGSTATTGWLGRWLDATEGATPNPLRALALGTGAGALTAGRAMPTVVLDPARFALRAPRGVDARAVTDALLATARPAGGGPGLVAARAAIPGALDALELLARVREPAEAASPDAPADGAPAPSGTAADSLTALLQVAAGVIELGLGTRVVLVGRSGFDTHAAQLGTHDELLADLGGGITAFFDRLERAGLADRVLLLTTSEFGRRVAENGSAGTDHGAAGVQLLAGPALRGGRVIGTSGLDRLVDGDLAATIDPRSVYATGLDWLGGPADDLLGGRFDRFGLL